MTNSMHVSSQIHKLLQKQLVKIEQSNLSTEDKWIALKNKVNETYYDYDSEVNQLRNILRESSSELLETNRQLESANAAIAINFQHEVNFMKMLIDQSGEAVQVANEEGVIMYVNQRAAERLGKKSEELIGCYIGDVEQIFKNKKDWKAHLDQLKEKGPHLTEGVHQRKDGTFFPVEANAFYSKIDNQGYVMALIRDISERKKMTKQMEDQNIFIRKVIDAVPNLIFVKDRKGHFVMVNQAVAELFGKRVDEIEFKANDEVHLVQDELDVFSEVEKEVIRTMGPVSVEEYFTRTDGTRRLYYTTKVPLKQDADTIDILGVSIDITEQKKIEEILTNSLNEKTTLLGEIHHRVKNNLTVIFGLLEMQIVQSDNEEIQRILRESQNRIQAMALVHEKLYKSPSIAKIEFNSYISELTQGIHKIIASKQEIEIRVHSNHAVYLSLNQMIPCGLLVNEVITNSFKYAFPDRSTGIIDLIVSPIDEDHWELTIKDNGIGMHTPLDHVHHTLGIPLIHTFAKQLKAQLQISTQPGVSYTLTIPYEREN